MTEASPADGRADGRCDVAALVADFHAELYRYACRLTGSTVDAEDLTQQTFLIAQRKLDQLRQATCVRSWLYAVLRNTYLKMKRRRFPATAALLDLDIEDVPQNAKPDDVDREKIQAAIDELPDEFKIVVLAFYFEDCSYREIADRLNVPPGTVMSRLSRAKSHLRARLFAPEIARGPQPKRKVVRGAHG
ncbi:MAG: RNA polymerase sigma factor [Planctomycetia bacterium]|nr:RNA polymerase sigma factor [Planctomycetia bacterium]